MKVSIPVEAGRAACPFCRAIAEVSRNRYNLVAGCLCVHFLQIWGTEEQLYVEFREC